MDLLLPDAALPIRIYECRKGYKGHGGSFQETISGLGVRLEDDKGKNLEPGFPSSAVVEVAGQKMDATIYAFKKGKAETYRNSEGIIFTINGQTHGHLTADIFRRKAVGHSYLADSILVLVDCGRLSNESREDLFMNSRDRLSGGELRQELEDELEDVLKNHQGLRELRARRQEEDTAEKFEDNKPLEDILQSLIQKSPTLANLFLFGSRASNPFKPATVKSEDKPFAGKRHPTFFKLKGKEYGELLLRETPLKQAPESSLKPTQITTTSVGRANRASLPCSGLRRGRAFRLPPRAQSTSTTASRHSAFGFLTTPLLGQRSLS